VQRYGEPKPKPPNNPRDELPDLIDWTALPPDHLLIPPKIIHVQPEQNSLFAPGQFAPAWWTPDRSTPGFIDPHTRSSQAVSLS
jgi:hypothetical protein